MTSRNLWLLHKFLVTCHACGNGNSGCNSLEVMRPYKLIAVQRHGILESRVLEE